jgi:hypothetical protein
MTPPVSLVEWLKQRGLPLQRAVLWAELVRDSLELLRDAHVLLRTRPEWDSFVASCRSATPTEPEVTSGLGDRMHRLWVASGQGSSRDRVRPTYERAIPGDHSHGIRKPRADFWFERKFEAGYCAMFVVEAKRLSAPADAKRKYLSSGGLGCFVARRPPYTEDVLGGMVGYIYNNVIPSWHHRIRQEMITPVCSTLRVGYVHVNSLGLEVLASDHDRISIMLPEQLTVVHIMLDF